MKNQYIIINKRPGSELYFRGGSTPIFTVKREYAEIYTNKRTAATAAAHATKYYSNGGCVYVKHI